jgi:hypothetical protein
MGAAVAGLGIKASGQRKAASAAGKAAQAQEAAAGRQQELAQAAADSPQQLAAIERQLGVQEKSLARQEKLAAAIDPVTLEASQQALGLLRGEESRSLDPIRKQRQRQRNALLDSLRENLGPGAESSSAGLQALRNFDLQTSDQLAGAQSGALSQIFGIAQGGQDQRFAQQAAGFGQAAQGFGQIASRKLQAVTGTGQGIIGSAGSQFVSKQLRAQSQSQIGSDIFKGAAGVAGGLFGGGDGGLFSKLTQEDNE